MFSSEIWAREAKFSPTFSGQNKNSIRRLKPVHDVSRDGLLLSNILQRQVPFSSATAHLLERSHLKLPDALAADVKFAPDFLEGTGIGSIESESADDDHPVSGFECVEQPLDPLQLVFLEEAFVRTRFITQRQLVNGHLLPAVSAFRMRSIQTNYPTVRYPQGCFKGGGFNSHRPCELLNARLPSDPGVQELLRPPRLTQQNRSLCRDAN